MVMMPPMFWIVSFGLLGAILGSFVNMAAYRLPRNISIVTRTRSFCPSCEHQLAWYDNLPILSYLLLLGRCRYCRKPIPIRYLLVELLIAGLFVAAAYQFYELNRSWAWYVASGGQWIMHPAIFGVQLFLVTDLVLLAVVDIEKWLIPTGTTLPWIAVGLLIAPCFPDLHPSATAWFPMPRLNALLDSFQGLVIGAGLPWTVNFLTMVGSYAWFRFHRGDSKARPLEGMGSGDCHLLGMIGALLGWKPVLATFFIGILAGCAVGVAKLLWTRLQRWRLGDTYRPWQPTFDVAKDEPAMPPAPVFWPLPLMGAIVLLAALLLWVQSQVTFKGAWFRTLEEELQGLFSEQSVFDVRLLSVWIMLLIGALLVVSYPFLRHLAATDSLPQGDIIANEKGEKQEVMQGNYIPFGPSLAAAALLVAFYDPLIRSFAFWWLALAGTGGMPPLPYRVLGQSFIIPLLVSAVQWFARWGVWVLAGVLVVAVLAFVCLLIRARGKEESEPRA